MLTVGGVEQAARDLLQHLAAKLEQLLGGQAGDGGAALPGRVILTASRAAEPADEFGSRSPLTGLSAAVGQRSRVHAANRLTPTCPTRGRIFNAGNGGAR